MALNKTLKASRITFGDDGEMGKRNIVSISLNKFDLKTPKTASTTAVSAAITGSASAVVSQGLSVKLDVPRSITVTAGGTAASITASAITVTGKNSEGKVITETFTPTADTAGTITGSKVFAEVTGVSIPVQDGAGATYSIGLGANFGIGSRNVSATQVKLFKKVVASGAESLVNPGSTNFSTTNVEDNWVTLDVTASGTSRYRVYALNYNWHLNPINGNPVYGA